LYMYESKQKTITNLRQEHQLHIHGAGVVHTGVV
jgi:hypothetical protein